ncbi:MAG: TonB-dependent receptor [Myxococcales bacterium]|nr:TonB-dependent receptor [Myxococcales bacterium]
MITITGRVIDSFGKPIRNATVSIEAMPQIAPATTDKQGRYRLAGVAIGAAVVISIEGYQTGLATVAGPLIDEVVLLSDKQATEVIEVQGEAPPASPGAAKLDRTELQRIPGTGNDLVRTLSAMPGIVNFQFPLGYSGVVIRGSSPQDSKVLIDDFEVPVLYHDIGFRSIVPTEAIDKLDYVPGGFDVAYGRAASGIVSLTTRPGSDERSEQLEGSIIDTGAIVQGSIDKSTHYMIAFRRSLIDLILPALIPKDADLALTTVPRYYDEQFRIDHTFSPRWRVRFSSVGSDDKLELFTNKAQSPDKRFFNRTRFIRLTSAAMFHDGPWYGSFALSGIAQEFVFERGISQYVNVRQPNVTARTEITRTAKDAGGLTNFEWRVGAEAAIGRTTIDLALPQERREGQPMGTDNPNDTSQRFNGSIWTPDFATWTAVSANLDPRIRFTTGVRVDAFARINDYAIQPRGELQIKLTPAVTARLSAGAYARPPEYQGELLFSNIHPEKSTQTIAGLQYEPREGFRLQSSLYYSDRTSLLTYAPDGRSLLNQGRGITYGAELFATVRSGPWFGFLSYSYSHSTRVDFPRAAERLFDFDQPHSLNLALSWKKGKWQLGGRFQLYSGLPNTPVQTAVFDSDANIYTPIFGAVNSDRTPIHNQLDLRLDRYWKWGPVQMSYFLDVQNVYLNDSVIAYFYSYDYSQRAAFKSLPIIPSMGFRGRL